VNYNYTFNEKIDSKLTLLYTDKNPASQETANLELKPKWQLKYKGEGYTLNLTTEKRFDLDGDNYTGENTSKIIDRLPEFVFNKSTATIGDTKINYNINASWGISMKRLQRMTIGAGEYIINAKRPINFSKYLTLTPSGIFRSRMYI